MLIWAWWDRQHSHLPDWNPLLYVGIVQAASERPVLHTADRGTSRRASAHCERAWTSGHWPMAPVQPTPLGADHGRMNSGRSLYYFISELKEEWTVWVPVPEWYCVSPFYCTAEPELHKTPQKLLHFATAISCLKEAFTSAGRQNILQHSWAVQWSEEKLRTVTLGLRNYFVVIISSKVPVWLKLQNAQTDGQERSACLCSHPFGSSALASSATFPVTALLVVLFSSALHANYSW